MLLKFYLITSLYLIEELSRVFSKPKIEKIISEYDASALIALIEKRAIVINPTNTVTLCRDPKNNPLLECAISCTPKVSCIVTLDEDLLILNPFRDIPIITPKKFISLLK